MTINELSILKNSILDSVEAYTDARLEDLPFAKTEIGVVTDNKQKDANNKTLHIVRVGSATRYKIYKNVLSTGNIEYPLNTVVFLVIPNGQYSNSFILGQLDTSPCNILGGEIHIGKMSETIDGKNYYFNVDKQGNTEILSGSLKFGYNQSLKDYNFIVDSSGIKNGIFDDNGKKNWKFKVDTSTGDVTITSGSIVLGGVTTNSQGLSATGVAINNNGLTMTKGSINLGIIGTTNKYRFSATDDGNIYCKNADGNDVFSVVNGAVDISGYLEDGAFSGTNTARGTDRTKIDGRHIETGYIRSTNLAFKVDNVNKDASATDADLSKLDANFTTKGMIIDLNNGFISSKKFYIDKDGNAKFSGEISGASGSIGGWTIESNYLHASVGEDGSANLSSGKLHLLAVTNNTWRQVCLNPASNKCYISGMELIIDQNTGELNGDTHTYGQNYIKITSDNITRNTDNTTVLWKNTSSDDLKNTNFVHKGGAYDFTITYEGGGEASGTILFSS